MKFRQTLTIFAFASALMLSSCSKESSPREFAEVHRRRTCVMARGRSRGSGGAGGSSRRLSHARSRDERLEGWPGHCVKDVPTVSNLKQNWKYLSGEGNLFALAYESSAIVKANETNPAISVSNNYLFVVRLSNGKVAEVWMNGSMTNKPQ